MTRPAVRFAAVGLLVGALMIGLFVVANALDVPILTDASPDLGEAGIGAAAVSFALLASDVLLPVPSSAVMVANGALFGTPGGAALSLAGSLAGALTGFVIGRRGSGLLARVAGRDAWGRGADLLERRGAVAIVVTRPVPVLGETVVILAGATGMSLRQVVAAAALGSLVPAIAYALAGSVAYRLSSGLVVLGGVVAVSAGVWWVTGRRSKARDDDLQGPGGRRSGARLGDR